MTRGKAENSSHRWVRVLGWMAACLAALFVPHVVISLYAHWPQALISIHGVSTLATLLLACTGWLANRGDQRERAAYEAGRLDTRAAEFAEFEQRIDHR